ncbi:BPSL0761 family protein [Burkholderia ambifaria]|uniref:BPSL0761 family protein n=1 Tax=Burkholderia ambifaria TaxID=152480 RepID=UPI003393F9B8
MEVVAGQGVEGMTTPSERTVAVLRTRTFLMELGSPVACGIPREIASAAENLLRHYPSLMDIELTCAMYPACWEMPVTRTRPGR